MKAAFRQIVVMADGEVRILPSTGAVAYGHRPPDERIKIVVPADKRWLLVELELELGRPNRRASSGQWGHKAPEDGQRPLPGARSRYVTPPADRTLARWPTTVVCQRS
jgi:hypothetical protein